MPIARVLQIIPAIDLRGGKCVRLRRGDPNEQTTYDGDPIERAKSFVAAGARQLHVVDLDGAFGSGENAGAIAAICRAVDVPVQTGGGIRTAADAKARFDAGVAFVILGTLLVENEARSKAIVESFPAKMFAGIDARGRSVAVRGWQGEALVDRDELVRRVCEWGIERVIFTAIDRDGTGEGYDLDALAAVANAAKIRVTASGGARTIDDLLALKQGPENIDAAIVGRAIYEGTIDLAEAIRICG